MRLGSQNTPVDLHLPYFCSLLNFNSSLPTTTLGYKGSTEMPIRKPDGNMRKCSAVCLFKQFSHLNFFFIGIVGRNNFKESFLAPRTEGGRWINLRAFAGWCLENGVNFTTRGWSFLRIWNEASRISIIGLTNKHWVRPTRKANTAKIFAP